MLPKAALQIGSRARLPYPFRVQEAEFLTALRVALYARVSTEEQAREGYSLSAQIRRMEAYARSRGWDVIGNYVDGGKSGRDTDRPGYL